MALPRKLKNMNLFNDGINYAGQVVEVTLPKLSRKMEEYRGGGMNGPVQIDLGQEALELQWTAGGFMNDVFKQYGANKHDAVLLRFAGAYQREDGSAVEAVEVVVRGRHKEIDFGTAKLADDTSFKVTTVLSYYKLSINGSPVIEIDVVNFINKVNDVDLITEERRAIGL